VIGLEAHLILAVIIRYQGQSWVRFGSEVVDVDACVITIGVHANSFKLRACASCAAYPELASPTYAMPYLGNKLYSQDYASTVVV
jgi:hypothetical protein